jgi:hypothetical protein
LVAEVGSKEHLTPPTLEDSGFLGGLVFVLFSFHMNIRLYPRQGRNGCELVKYADSPDKGKGGQKQSSVVLTNHRAGRSLEGFDGGVAVEEHNQVGAQIGTEAKRM